MNYNSSENNHTYVLFGKEAVRLYNKSILHLLITTKDISYKVEKYKEVKDFFLEQKNWKDFVEISSQDYIRLNEHIYEESPTIKRPKKKFWSFKLFD